MRGASPCPSLVLAAAFVAMAAGGGPGAAGESLSAAERMVVAKGIATLRNPGERRMANGWSEAKQAAEFICRPVALDVLKRRNKAADRVFLGIDPTHDLTLHSDRLLTGKGSVRTPDGWRDFHFTCTLDAATGKVVSLASR